MSSDPDFDLSGGATREATVAGGEHAHPYLELQLLSADQQEFRLPFLRAEIDLFREAPLAFPSGSRWIARLSEEEVELTLVACPHSGVTGDESAKLLVAGSSYEIEGMRICLLDARLPPVGTLVGLTAPYTGKVWNLTNQHTWLGRKGKRLNHIEVNHSTISRTQLTLSADAQGQVELLAESGTTSVNGQSLNVGEKARLSSGALVLCGELLFRLSLSADGLDSISTAGDYVLLQRIGLGGMSEVFSARRREDPCGDSVALKLMHRELADDPAAVERFRREVRAYQALVHRNLPTLLDWGEGADGRLYLVMELLEGETLKERLERDPVLPDVALADILTGVAAGLDHLHASGLVHRDVKPSNVFCLRAGGTKLMDLGIVHDQELAPLTHTGMLVGTPHYVAPEQVCSQATAASDQYSMAVMAFEMLAGRRPFLASTAESLMSQHQSRAAPLLGQFRPGAPPELEAALEKALSKNPKARFPSCGAAAAAIIASLSDALAEDTAF